MSAFLDAQPEAARDRLSEILAGEAVPQALCMYLDFAETPLAICNRTVPFTDSRWGRTWDRGAGLLIGLPDLALSAGQLNTFREYKLGFPEALVSKADWMSEILTFTGDRANYARREASLWGQIFDPVTDQPVGHPFAHDVALMDQMALSVSREAMVITLTVESFLARHGVPLYGAQTYRDQKRRYPTDEGMEFTAEADRLIVWTQW
ncbi:hypothetical protein [Ponticoccus alexandrii]|uniref:DUF4261 domain-containing protein n=1 Tax=Ponticoccus alexandrii TaxID=1943633 RepID=A0ABX7F8C5_9RHOB|nr:hypothetical protein [Ponticoccus alexandrii]ETA53988.1 hypothetical protein P279_00380 [Rhodobacteraceae bacterium PD-2]QRF66386.1 hypothetical protein GQA70_08725 [Ponticoccus alexandrii]